MPPDAPRPLDASVRSRRGCASGLDHFHHRDGSRVSERAASALRDLNAKSRAELIAEVKAARDSGTLYQRDGDPVLEQQLKSAKTRAEVRAELDLARLRGGPEAGEAYMFGMQRGA